MIVQNRNGRIMGLLVLILLLTLLPVWAAGHWLAGKYPAIGDQSNIADHDPLGSPSPDHSAVTKGTLPEGTPPTHRQPHAPTHAPTHAQKDAQKDDGDDGTVIHGMAARESDSPGLDPPPGPATNLVQQRLEADRDRLIAENQQLLVQQESSREQVSLTASKNESLGDQNRKLQSELQGLQDQVETQAQQLRSARTSLQEMEGKIVALKSMTVTAPPVVDAAPMETPSLSKPARQRRWRSIAGKVVPAKFEGLQGDIVLLSTRGKTFRVPLSKLVPEDQAIARELSQQQ